ncbi:MAG: hypothetical protein ACFFFG_07755 [Candidatus Thorarchaeota archaeon]
MADLFLISMITLFHALIIAILLVVSFRRWLNTRYRQFLWFTLDYLGVFAWFFLVGLQLLVLALDPYNLSINFLMTDIGIPILKTLNTGELVSMTLADVLGFTGFFTVTGFTIFLVIFFDSAHRTSYDPIKLFIFGIIATAMVVFASLPGTAAKSVSAYLHYTQIIFWSFRAILVIIYAGNLYMNSTGELKNKASIFLIGSFIYLVAQLMIVTQLLPLDIGLVEITYLLGSFFIMIAFISDPRLLFILPFKTSQLVIIDTNTKKPLVSYSWISQNDRDLEDLHPGMIAVVDALSSGLHELSLENSVLLINRQTNITCIIVTSNTSKALNNSLNIFTSRFATAFGVLPETGFSKEEYDSLNQMVHETFPFVSVYSA